nr:SyfB [Porphyrostromium japonicum]
MKISWEWLNSFVDLRATSPSNVAEQLTLAGCEIEEINQTRNKKDYILEITSTPNRADLLGMVGIAKEICAILKLRQHIVLDIEDNLIAQEKELELVNYNDNNSNLSIIAGYCCITNIHQKPTPGVIRNRLEASGVKVTDTINDLSNYVMLKWGHPVEIIDASELIPIQAADISFTKKAKKTNEHRNDLIEIVYTQCKDTKVGITGVRTESSYEATERSCDICLHVNVIPVDIVRRNSKYCNIRNESSTRHERGLSQDGLRFALLEAILLIKKIYPEALVGNIYNNMIERSGISKSFVKLRVQKVRAVLGKIKSGIESQEITVDQIHKILTSLGCSVIECGNFLRVAIPSNRQHDLSREIDLIEEIARVQGFNSFQATLPEFVALDHSSYRNFILKELERKLRSLGMTEVIHYSLASQDLEEKIQLKNPLMTEYSCLRTNLLLGLIDSFSKNVKRGNCYFDAFEVGRVFQKEDNIIEQEAIAGIFGGRMMRKTWQSSLSSLDWFEAKGIIELFLHQISASLEWDNSINTKYKELLHPNKSSAIYLEGIYVGVFGQIHPEIVAKENLPQAIYCFELDLAIVIDSLGKNKIGSSIFKEYSQFPSVVRDMAIVTSLETKVASVIEAIKNEKCSILREAQLFDEYRGSNMKQGQKSIAFRLVYQSRLRTLTTSEVDEVHDKIKNKVTQQVAT